MHSIWIKLTLIDDAIFSDSMRTTGGHTTLPYITGASLLGAAASKLYARTGVNSYELFHGGDISFGNAYPLVQNEVAYPMPLSLQHVKHDAGFYASEYKHLSHQKVINTVVSPLKAGIQYKAIRSGFISPSGRHIQSRTREDTKSANGRNRIVKKSQLFSYQSIASGQSFVSEITLPNSTLQEKLIKTLTGKLYLGRSRSAQYAKINAEVLDSPPADFSTKQNCGLIVCWAISDICLINEVGESTLIPEPSLLFGELGQHLTFDPVHSSLRFRHYAPYNGKRRHYDMDRHVITAGSVMAYRPQNGNAIDASKLPTQVGLHREHGLGRLRINPELLSDENPVFSMQTASTPPFVSTMKPLVNSTLCSAINAHSNVALLHHHINAEADRFKHSLKPSYQNSELAKNLPSGSQWSRVVDAALTEQDIHKILSVLKHDCWKTHLKQPKQTVSEYFISQLTSTLESAHEKFKPDINTNQLIIRKFSHQAMFIASNGGKS